MLKMDGNLPLLCILSYPNFVLTLSQVTLSSGSGILDNFSSFSKSGVCDKSSLLSSSFGDNLNDHKTFQDITFTVTIG